MTFATEKKFQDIAFFHIDKSPPAKKNPNPLLIAAAGAFTAVILVGVGVFIGLRIDAAGPPCCLPLDFPFDLDFGA